MVDTVRGTFLCPLGWCIRSGRRWSLIPSPSTCVQGPAGVAETKPAASLPPDAVCHCSLQLTRKEGSFTPPSQGPDRTGPTVDSHPCPRRCWCGLGVRLRVQLCLPETPLFAFKVREVLAQCEVSSEPPGIDISGFSPIRITPRMCKLHLRFEFMCKIVGWPSAVRLCITKCPSLPQKPARVWRAS